VIEVTLLKIPDVKLVRPRRFGDDRGYFCETWNRRIFARAGLSFDFCQDNHSLSADRGTVRGLHFQVPPFAQTKLIRVLKGAIFDVAVDIRSGSPTYGRHVSATLSSNGGELLLVPRGFAHGFCTLEAGTEIAYKVDAHYDRDSDLGMLWCDADLGIEWPVSPDEAVLSEKDREHPPLAALPTYFAYAETVKRAG
jgi:dTDP-4-dehydrorhamnose 3,5-epimerase